MTLCLPSMLKALGSIPSTTRNQFEWFFSLFSVPCPSSLL
jgi:hypothetical protein